MTLIERFANILDRSPDNAARAPRSDQPGVHPTGAIAEVSGKSGNAAPMDGQAGANARAINASRPGSAKSPMDNVRIRPAPAPDQLAGVPFPTPEQVRRFDAFLRAKGYERPADAYAALELENAPWLRLQQAIATASENQRSRFQAHIDDIARRTAEGDTSVVKEDSWSREDWEQDAQVRRAAFKVELNKIRARAWAIAEPALFEKAQFALEVADELEAQARVIYDEFAAPFYPPSYVLLLRKYASTLTDGSRQTAGLPTAMLEVL